MLNIYWNCWNQQSAGQYYRLRAPAKAMEKEGLSRCFVDDPFQDPSLRQPNLFNSHVQVHFLTAGKAIHAQTKMTSEFKPARNGEGRMQYPPVIVFDVDDDIEQVNPMNPKFCVLGTRVPGSDDLMMPRNDVGIMMDDGDPEPMYLWRHGMSTAHGVFDSARNVKNHAQVRKMAATAHAITCTSEPLAQIVRKWNPRVHVYPNSLLFDDFQKFDIRRRPDEVRVLWQGGYSHFADFYPLRGAFREASQRMPQVKWIIFGTLFNCVYENIPQPLVEFHGWQPFERFHMKYGALAFDINIAPLADTRFNRCKSAIKWYEASALGIPTLAQNAGPYRDEIVDGETGVLFQDKRDFVEKLQQLVMDADYRKKIGGRAQEWVREHRDARKNVHQLAGFYHSLIRDTWGVDVAV